MAQDFTISLSNIQEVWQKASSYVAAFWTLSKNHVVKMIGIKQEHMVCLLQAELNTDRYLCAVIWVNE